MNLFMLFFGYRRIYANRENCLTLLNLCMEREFSYTDFESDGEGGVSFVCSEWTARRLLRMCASRGICVCDQTRGGFPHFLWRYRRRAGMALGLLVGVVLLWLSGRFVWDVRVTGNETMSATEVRQALRACGFGVGSYIPDFQNSELENRVMLTSDRISWISVYMDGTVAMVQIKENVMPPPQESTNPANLIATHDGQIELLELYRGNCVVKIGQAVRAGELLVSGLYDSNTVGYRYTRAAGQVLARVEEEIRIEIPLTYEKKVYEESRLGGLGLEFFDFSLKIFENSRNSTLPCDIIKERNALDLFGYLELPFAWNTTTLRPYRTVAETRTSEEALSLAYEDLERELESRLSDAQMLQKNISTSLTDTALILDCSVVCIRNIAEQVEFEVLP